MAKRKVKQRKQTEYSVGDLDKRIIVHDRSIAAPDFNSAAFKEDYNSGFEAWARVDTIDNAGVEKFDDVEIEKKPTHIFVIRYRPKVTSEKRIRWRDSFYEILEVVDHEERNEWLLLKSKLLGDQALEANT